MATTMPWSAGVARFAANATTPDDCGAEAAPAPRVATPKPMRTDPTKQPTSAAAPRPPPRLSLRDVHLLNMAVQSTSVLARSTCVSVDTSARPTLDEASLMPKSAPTGAASARRTHAGARRRVAAPKMMRTSQAAVRIAAAPSTCSAASVSGGMARWCRDRTTFVAGGTTDTVAMQQTIAAHWARSDGAASLPPKSSSPLKPGASSSRRPAGGSASVWPRPASNHPCDESSIPGAARS
mmetsp:Transcript_28664/g.98639  ORF Transcript_28664/g.98639 Transcript_28664/m.98639 type:complete len:238 (-) Transcript_28664:48-761(-)